MIYADDSELNFRMQRVMDMVNAIRLICGEMNVAPSEKKHAHITALDTARSGFEG